MTLPRDTICNRQMATLMKVLKLHQERMPPFASTYWHIILYLGRTIEYSPHANCVVVFV